MSLDDLRTDVVDTITLLYRQGLITAYGGNVSARIAAEDEFSITPTAIFKGALKPEDIVICDMKGNVVEGVHKPSIEAPIHASIYQRRPDVNAVIHAHNPIATAMGIAGVRIPALTAETIVGLGDVPIVPYIRPGSRELGDAVANSMVYHSAAILKNHGVVAVGPNLKEAAIRVQTLEEAARITLAARLFGKLTPIAPKEVKYIKSHFLPQPSHE